MTQQKNYAPLWKRLLSTVYDSLILVAVSLAYFALVTLISSVIFGRSPSQFNPNAEGLWVQIGWLITIVSFYCYFWMKIGQTVAMKAWRLRVISDDGKRLRFSTCLLRFFLGILSFCVFGLGYFWALFDRDNKALHDRLTKSSVVIVEREQS
jgi:uncharacterized RDD family membrane protein YckC